MNQSKTLVKDWPVWLIMLLPFVLTIYYWDQIPEKIAMHWNSAGEVDRWGEKGWEAFLLPVISIGVYLLLIVVPYIDPKRKTDNAQKALRAFRYLMPIFFSSLAVVVLFQWLGSDFDPTTLIYLAMGVFFMVIGNYMQTIKPNYFIGIRTPWTLESEDNWRKTHRLGGKLWVFAGIAILILYFVLPQEFQIPAMLVLTIGSSIVAIGFSFYLFTQEKGSQTESIPTENEPS